MPDKKQKVTLPPDVMEAYLELSKDCIGIYSLDGALEYCNPANLEVFGYGPEDLCGITIKEMPFLQQHIHRLSSLRDSLQTLHAFSDARARAPICTGRWSKLS